MDDDLPSDLDTDKEHVSEAFSGVNGFAVKDRHQIFHPSTELRPAVDPATTHYTDDTSVNEAREVKALLDNRYVQCAYTPCSTGLECVGMGCDVCIIYGAMRLRFCHHGDFFS